MNLTNKNIFGLKYFSLESWERKAKSKELSAFRIGKSNLYKLLSRDIKKMTLEQIEIFCFALDISPEEALKSTFVYSTKIQYVEFKKIKSKIKQKAKISLPQTP